MHDHIANADYEDGVSAAGEGDFFAAVFLWRRAARRGHTKAQYSLGVA